jgi:hypothetical protein
MKIKQFTRGITFFVTHSMYQHLKNMSEQKIVAVFELLREAVAVYLEDQGRGHEAR